jgi:hypothetical protein
VINTPNSQLLWGPTAVVIDHLDNIRLERDTAEVFQNELAALGHLRGGLDFLDRRVREVEEEMLERTLRRSDLIPDPWEALSTSWVASAFHWYSTSAHQYAQTVGWLATQNAKGAKAYAARALPELTVWRHKVGAHYARTDPRKDDSLADLISSVQFPVTFHGTEFWAGMHPIAIRDAGRLRFSRNDMAWSLTRVHRDMCTRYWPMGVHDDSEFQSGVTETCLEQ